MTAQEQIGEALVARGYVSKHATAWVVKSYLKMLEEVCELGRMLPLTRQMRNEIVAMERTAKTLFDAAVAMGDDYNPEVGNHERLRKEAADVGVTLMDLANGIGVLTGVGFDVVEAAVQKATADVERGVRGVK